MASLSDLHWRLPADQHLAFEDFDDGIVLFDALVGGTHLVNATAAEALTIVEETPGLTAADIHGRLLQRLQLTADALPLPALEALLRRLADLNLVAGRLA